MTQPVDPAREPAGDREAAGRELLDLEADSNEFVNQIEKEEYQGVLAKLREMQIEHLLPAVLA